MFEKPTSDCCLLFFFHLRLFFFSPSLVVWLNLRLCARNPNPKHAADWAGTVDMLVRSSLVEMVHLFSRGSSTSKSWGLNARMWKSRISRFLQEQKLWFWVFTWSEWEQLLPTAKRCAKAAKKSFSSRVWILEWQLCQLILSHLEPWSGGEPPPRASDPCQSAPWQKVVFSFLCIFIRIRQMVSWCQEYVNSSTSLLLLEDIPPQEQTLRGAFQRQCRFPIQDTSACWSEISF